ncbi:FtsK/SpoIIIE domain-containing protein [Clostridium gasigenes]|uniref:FtsK/SpoIIIE domain-containing protein n=1 Tax=Clostridium gasigenes TaxID=94869 RepID=UPI001C0C465F|nr:FtsK/SpoIIIE domain-containing protein [Clostridium gasigenes]MBU3106712.1 hypothetical protein [Clostridium gasigenes]
MLLESLFGIGVAEAVTLNATKDWRAKRREIKEIKYKWDILMNELNVCSKQSNYTFHIVEVEIIENGYTLTIHVPTGLTYTDLESEKEAVQNSFKGIATMEKVRFSSLIKLRIINRDIGRFEFVPVKAYAHQLYIGKTFDNKDYFVDITKASHILIGGATGTGKTFLLSSILTNLIYNSSKSIEIHLSQIMKGEIGLFKDCKPIKFIGMNLKEVAFDLQKVAKTVDSRSKKFTELGVKNLQHYNKHYSKSKMKRIYYIIEEISFSMPHDADSEETK